MFHKHFEANQGQTKHDCIEQSASKYIQSVDRDICANANHRLCKQQAPGHLLFLKRSPQWLDPSERPSHWALRWQLSRNLSRNSIHLPANIKINWPNEIRPNGMVMYHAYDQIIKLAEKLQHFIDSQDIFHERAYHEIAWSTGYCHRPYSLC